MPPPIISPYNVHPKAFRGHGPTVSLTIRSVSESAFTRPYGYLPPFPHLHPHPQRGPQFRRTSTNPLSWNPRAGFRHPSRNSRERTKDRTTVSALSNNASTSLPALPSHPIPSHPSSARATPPSMNDLISFGLVVEGGMCSTHNAPSSVALSNMRPDLAADMIHEIGSHQNHPCPTNISVFAQLVPFDTQHQTCITNAPHTCRKNAKRIYATALPIIAFPVSTPQYKAHPDSVSDMLLPLSGRRRPCTTRHGHDKPLIYNPFWSPRRGALLPSLLSAPNC